MNCPCGKPAVLKMWEAGTVLCGYHAKKWLRSEEKKIIGECIAAEPDDVKKATVPYDNREAHAALLRFVASVERDATRWEKLLRRVIRPIWKLIIGGPRG